MEVDPVHVKPLDLLEVSVLGLGAVEAGQPRVSLLHPDLHLLSLRGQEPEFWHVARLVHVAVIVTDISCNNNDDKIKLVF